jgi:predicted enzyme related to lactoylglutathione lyase
MDSKRIDMKKEFLYLVLVLALTLGGCAGKSSLPAIASADSESELVGKFVWRELLTENREGVERFYGELFGWTFQTTDLPEYKLILHQDRPIAGMVSTGGETKQINESQWVSLLSVANVDDAVRQVHGARGEVHVEPVDIPERGRLAVVSDAQGALLAFVRAKKGDPPDRDPSFGEWLWTELWTDDVDGAFDFYGGLVGYEREAAPRDKDYTVLRSSGAPRAGILALTVKEIRPHWLPYVRVENARAVAERVEALGGKVVLAPREDIRDGTVAIIADPSGAVLAVQQWPRKG